MHKLKRYLGNTNTVEIHDTHQERSACQLDEIKPEHRRWYDALQEAKREVITMATRKVGRSAVTGRFVKQSTVRGHPRTTVTQTVKSGRRRK